MAPTRTWLAVGLLIASTRLGTGEAHADLVPVSQVRSIISFAQVVPVEGDVGFDSEFIQFLDLGAFDDDLELEVTVGDAASHVTTFQVSEISATGVTASGGFASAATLGTTAEFAEALGSTGLTFRFDATSVTHVRIAGTLTATGGGRATVTLVGPGDLLLHIFAEAESRYVDQLFALAPGVHEMTLSTGGYGQALPTGEFPSTGGFELSLSVVAPAAVDLTGDPTANPLRVVPNPMSTHTEIRFSGNAAMGRPLLVFDGSGRRIRDLGNVTVPTISWNGRDDRGEPVPHGVYFLRVPGTPISARAIVLGR